MYEVKPYTTPTVCVKCGERTNHLVSYALDYQYHWLGLGYELLYSRDYHCSNCRAVMSVSTVENTNDIDKLIGKDKEWLESLKLEKNS